MSTPVKNTICLWYNGDAEEAAQFYAKTFPNSSVDAKFTARHSKITSMTVSKKA